MPDYTHEVVDWIGFHAAAQPDKLAQIDLASGRRFTYLQMHDRVGRIAAVLKAHGVKKGDRVGFLALNSTDIMEIIFATWRIGAVSLALNFRLTAEELEFIINDAAPSIIFIDDVFAETADALKQITSVGHWMRFDGVGGDTEFERAIKDAAAILEMIELATDDMCLLMYSSGTTGRPKGVIVTHGMMLWSAVNCRAGVGFTEQSVNLSFMPLFHIGGLNVFACPAAYAGGTSVIMRIVDASAILETINDADIGVTHFLAVPAIYNGLRQHPKIESTDFSRVEAALAGAEAVPVELVKWWIDKGLIIQEGYGMTETAASSTLLRRDEIPHKLGSAGCAGMHGKMAIFRDDGTPAPRGEPGELWVCGPTITPGYWNRPEANKECFVDGWFKTGDIARQDEEGYFYIEDRLKDMYISAGENIYPAEIENVLYEMQEIAEVAIIGIPDEKWGEAGCACVVFRQEKNLDLADLVAHCKGRLATYKQPTHMLVLDELPRNATGKVLKYQLRQSVPKKLMR